jgi:amidohydrolase
MAIVAGLAPRLREAPPPRGEVHLVFQPAEEVGRGAARMLEDPRVSVAEADWCFAAHNLPGHPLGEVVLREGTFAAASTGFAFHLGGTSSHAAEPERGTSPAPAMAHLVAALSALPQYESALDTGAKVTVVHARLGEPAFGTSPGDAVVMATFRAYETSVLERLVTRAKRIAAGAASAHGLTLRTEQVDPFPATVNHGEAVHRLERAAASLGMRIVRAEAPFPWSEDFGYFTAGRRGALFGLGAGEEQPPLHHPSYDFPDALLERGTDLLEAVTRACLGEEAA